MQSECSETPSASESVEVARTSEEVEETTRKRPATEKGRGPPEKRTKGKAEEKDTTDELPMNVPFKIVDGVRHLSPYWAVYRTRTKGRWIGRKLVDAFTQEFVSLNKHYMTIACRLGRIYVNGKQMTDVDYVMKNGDRIEHWGHRHEHPVKDLPIEFIAETDDLLVVNKPPSLPVHACGQYAVHTVLGQLRLHYGKTGLRVLHRLDRTTSGVLLFAKNYETDLDFKQTLKRGEWTKEYVCLVDGVFPEEEVVCEQPIGTLVISMGIQCVREDGKHAKSSFKRLWTDGKISAVSVKIETGRTHQIRVHAQYLGFPIVGDKIYNSTVWGEGRGKDANYGKGFEELRKDVQMAHKRSQWLESTDPAYDERMEKMAEEEISPEPEGLAAVDRPLYDPYCFNCHVVKKEVPTDHFQLYLHCLRYETEKWGYTAPLPSWAVDPSTSTST